MKPEVLTKIRTAKESGATELYLTDNNITNVALLTEMTKLVTLSLPENQITDVSPLAGLTELEVLSLVSNRLTDVTPLAGLVKLKTLYLGGNSIPADQQAMLRNALPNCKIYFD